MTTTTNDNEKFKIKPLKIICLTEESVETLFLIGKGDLIKGVSQFVKRPKEALHLPKVSAFTSSNMDKIIALKPDLILGYSDIQKDIARDLIEKGQDVWISNHRSIDELLRYIHTLGSLVGAQEESERLIEKLLNKINEAKEFTQTLQTKPKIYFEEWDEPMISAIKWVSEIIGLCGGIEINSDIAAGNLAKERFVKNGDIIAKNPDIIFGCWCGKRVRIQKILDREGWETITAIKNRQVFELEPEIFLQPGPAVILDGIDILIDYIKKWDQDENNN